MWLGGSYEGYVPCELAPAEELYETLSLEIKDRDGNLIVASNLAGTLDSNDNFYGWEGKITTHILPPLYGGSALTESRVGFSYDEKNKSLIIRMDDARINGFKPGEVREIYVTIIENATRVHPIEDGYIPSHIARKEDAEKDWEVWDLTYLSNGIKNRPVFGYEKAFIAGGNIYFDPRTWLSKQ
jgi:hypothetical protein